jgi:hypothetical protein
MIDNKYLLDSNILNIYQFGSRVYGNNTEESDYDDINIQVFTIESFKNSLNNHDIVVLECLFLPDSNIYKKLWYDYQIVEWGNFKQLDKQKLRTSISTITSNSWVKGKKKLTVANDYDKYLAIKSVFHSLRILDFGIQIATENKIYNYSSTNWLYYELVELSDKYERDELWDIIDNKYRSLYNSKSTEFKRLCPKELTTKHYEIELNKILSKYNVTSGDIYKIIALFN